MNFLISFSLFFLLRYGFFMMVSFTLTFFMGISLKKHEWYVNLNHIASFVRPGNKFLSKTDRAMALADKSIGFFIPVSNLFPFYFLPQPMPRTLLFDGNLIGRATFYQIKRLTNERPFAFFEGSTHDNHYARQKRANVQWKISRKSIFFVN